MLPLQGSTFQEEGVTTWVGFPPGEWVDEPFPPSQTGDSSGERGWLLWIPLKAGDCLAKSLPPSGVWELGLYHLVMLLFLKN